MGFPNYDVAKMLLKTSLSSLFQPLLGVDAAFHNNKIDNLCIMSYCGASA